MSDPTEVRDMFRLIGSFHPSWFNRYIACRGMPENQRQVFDGICYVGDILRGSIGSRTGRRRVAAVRALIKKQLVLDEKVAKRFLDFLSDTPILIRSGGGRHLAEYFILEQTDTGYNFNFHYRSGSA